MASDMLKATAGVNRGAVLGTKVGLHGGAVEFKQVTTVGDWKN